MCKFSRLGDVLKKRGGLRSLKNVGERGQRFSGGQIQRIGLARALYKNSKIIILDEATNSLDKKSEKIIYQLLNKLKDDYTFIVVSHDLNNLDICNKILEINQNKISISRK